MRRQVAITDEDAIRALTEQVATLTLQLQGSQLGVNVIASCHWCHKPHPSEACQVGNPLSRESYEKANFVGNNNTYRNTYNPT